MDVSRRVAMLLALVSAAPLTGWPAVAAEQRIRIDNFTFKPAAVTIHAGTDIVFENADDIPHSVVMTDGSFHSKALDTGDTVALPSLSVGEHAYFCGLHPHMQGKIVVLP